MKESKRWATCRMLMFHVEDLLTSKIKQVNGSAMLYQLMPAKPQPPASCCEDELSTCLPARTVKQLNTNNCLPFVQLVP
jgi:hypothetical protein